MLTLPARIFLCKDPVSMHKSFEGLGAIIRAALPGGAALGGSLCFPLDNNPDERAIRPLAIGRKNWLFFGSMESGEAAATLLSLVQTCRALKINPRTYLEDVCRRIMGHSARKLDELVTSWAIHGLILSAQKFIRQKFVSLELSRCSDSVTDYLFLDLPKESLNIFI